MNAIKSDDPLARAKLTEKLESLQNKQKRMKLINAAHRKYLKSPSSLEKTDLSHAEKQIVMGYSPAYQWEPNPFPPYALTNNNSRIKQVKGRLAALQQEEDSVRVEIEYGDITYVENVDINRVQILFPDKPDEDLRKKLKNRGFRYSYNEGAWQRQLNENGRHAAKAIIQQIQ